MEPSREIPLIFIVVLIIGTTRGNHFLRGCQDVDPKCAILDEMRAAGGMYGQEMLYPVQFNSERRDEWHKRSQHIDVRRRPAANSNPWLVMEYYPLCSDSALAQEWCDGGSDHYCSVSCNRCPASQDVIMLVGGKGQVNGKGTPQEWILNPTFISLNGSLPACYASAKNDIDSSLSEIQSPALFTNQGENF